MVQKCSSAVALCKMFPWSSSESNKKARKDDSDSISSASVEEDTPPIPDATVQKPNGGLFDAFDTEELRTKKAKVGEQIHALKTREGRSKKQLMLPREFCSVKWAFLLKYQQDNRRKITIAEWRAISARVEARLNHANIKRELKQKLKVRMQLINAIEKRRGGDDGGMVAGVADDVLNFESQSQS